MKKAARGGLLREPGARASGRFLFSATSEGAGALPSCPCSSCPDSSCPGSSPPGSSPGAPEDVRNFPVKPAPSGREGPGAWEPPIRPVAGAEPDARGDASPAAGAAAEIRGPGAGPSAAGPGREAEPSPFWGEAEARFPESFRGAAARPGHAELPAGPPRSRTWGAAARNQGDWGDGRAARCCEEPSEEREPGTEEERPGAPAASRGPEGSAAPRGSSSPAPAGRADATIRERSSTEAERCSTEPPARRPRAAGAGHRASDREPRRHPGRPGAGAPRWKSLPRRASRRSDAERWRGPFRAAR
jgi:hypothetical protein